MQVGDLDPQGRAGWGPPGAPRSSVRRVSPKAPTGQSVPQCLCHSDAALAPEEPGHLGEPCLEHKASAAGSECALEPAPFLLLGGRAGSESHRARGSCSGPLYTRGSGPTPSAPPPPPWGLRVQVKVHGPVCVKTPRAWTESSERKLVLGRPIMVSLPPTRKSSERWCP